MPNSNRIHQIDLLRGIVMIIMALDHTRDFFHIYAFTDDPLNLQTTTPLLFSTRWITHFCAPVFVFLSGTAAYLQGLRKNKKQLSIFLITRGLWLILIEVGIISLAITFNIYYSLLILQVIWAIGISMVIMGIAVWLPFRLIFALGLIIVLGHNTLDYWEANNNHYPLWYNFLHKSTRYTIPDGPTVILLYPFLPWTGVMFLGYCFGKLYQGDTRKRDRKVALIGAGSVALFIILRYFNIYGNPFPWNSQHNKLYTFFSFINTEKYPPSLLYLCMTIGPALILLGLLGNVRNRFTEIISVYGRVPLFYYILHFYILHAISFVMFLLQGHSMEEGTAFTNVPFKYIIPGQGYGLGVVYLVWLIVVIGLYPLCKWFADYKYSHKQVWLSYI